MSEAATPRPRPCASCPYRRSVPSGVWDASEYVKLLEYDGETFDQPTAVFYCHTQDGHVCSGWLGHADPSQFLSLRLAVSAGTVDAACFDYRTDVPLFASGAEAAAHGMKEIARPSREAQETIRKIVTRREQ